MTSRPSHKYKAREAQKMQEVLAPLVQLDMASYQQHGHTNQSDGGIVYKPCTSCRAQGGSASWGDAAWVSSQSLYP